MQPGPPEIGRHDDHPHPGLGHGHPVESAEGTAEFAVRAAEALQPPALFLSANCDLEFLPQEIARRKVLRLGETAAIVKERLA